MAWEEIVREKRQKRAALISPWLNYVNGEEPSSADVLNIGNVKDLTSLYAAGELQVRDVVRKYVRR